MSTVQAIGLKVGSIKARGLKVVSVQARGVKEEKGGGVDSKIVIEKGKKER